MYDEEVTTQSPKRRRRRQAVALAATSALMLSGPLVAAAVASDTLASSSGDSESSGEYVGPDPSTYGTIEVESGKIDQVTSNESGAFGMTLSDGKPHGPILIQQLEVKGDGKYKIVDPAPGKLAKNLNSFSPTLIDIQNADGQPATDADKEAGNTYAVWEDEVKDGETKQYRWLGLLPENRIPFSLETKYFMDGKQYSDPEELVGKSGQVEVQFKWTAFAGRKTTLYYKDSTGQPVSEQVPTYLPGVGVFKMPLPNNFTNVRPITMDAGGDGYGGTLLAGTLVMAPPLGPTEITTGFVANVEDFYMPTGIVEWVYANVTDNASFSVIGGALGAIGGSLTGASASLAGAGGGLSTLSTTLDAVGGALQEQQFTKAIQSIAKGINGVSGKVSNINKQLALLVSNGANQQPCDLVFTLQELAKLTQSPPGAPDLSNPAFCSMTDLQSGAIGRIDTVIQNEIGQVNDAVGALLTDLAAAYQPLTVGVPAGTEDVGTGSGILAKPPAGIGPCAATVWQKNPTHPDYIATEKDAPFATNDPAIDDNVKANFLGTLVNILAAASNDTLSAIAIKTLLSALGVPDPDASLQQLKAFYAENPVYSVPCAAAALTASVEPLVSFLPSVPGLKTDLSSAINAILAKVTLEITTKVLEVVAAVNQLTSAAISALSTVAVGVAGINQVIANVSLKINGLVVSTLGGVVGGLSSALPALGSTLGNVAGTLNKEYALFNSYAFQATLGGAQPFGPPWKPQDITDYQVDPNTGAVVTPPATSGAPLEGASAPASSTQPVSTEGEVTPGVPETTTAQGDPTIQAMDKRGFQAYQIDLIGFGGEYSSHWGLYSGAILLLLAGGVGGGLIARARRQ